MLIKFTRGDLLKKGETVYVNSLFVARVCEAEEKNCALICDTTGHQTVVSETLKDVVKKINDKLPAQSGKGK